MDNRDWATMFLLAFLFGGSFFFTEIASSDAGPLTIAAARLVIGGVLLAAILQSGRVDPGRRPSFGTLALLGFFNSFLPIALIAWAQRELASSVTAILVATSPIFGAVLAHFFAQGDRLTPQRVVGTLVAFVGVVLIIDPRTVTAGQLGIAPFAPFAALLAALSSAGGGVFGRHLMQRDVTPLAAATGQVICAAVMATVMAAIVERPWQGPMPGTATIASLVAMGALSTALAYFLFFRLLARVGAARTLFVGFLVPACATLLGVAFLGERLRPIELMGLVLVLASVFLINRAALNKTGS